MRIHFFLQLARTTRASLVLLGCSVVVLSFLHTPTPFIGDDLPGWLRETARQPLPGYDKKVHAVVLHDEQQTQVADNGRIISSRRCAVRILVREGRSAAIAREIYLPGSGKVRDFRGWLSVCF